MYCLSIASKSVKQKHITSLDWAVRVRVPPRTPLNPRHVLAPRRREPSAARRTTHPGVDAPHQPPGRVRVVGLYRVHLDRLLHLDLEPRVGRVRERGVVRVGIADQDLALLAGGALSERRDLLAVVARGAAVVGLPRDEAADERSEGGDRAGDDGEVDLYAGPDGNVHTGDCWRKEKKTC